MSDAIIARIRDALEHSGISQGELARRIDATPAAVSRWLSGDREFPEERLKAISEALGVSHDSLLAADAAEASVEGVAERVTWHFRAAPSDGGQDGGNANVYATPAGVDTLAREAGQNSGDQCEESSNLRIQIALIELQKGEGAYERFCEALRLSELSAHMQASAETDFRSSQKVRAALDRLEASDRLYLLRFSDFGATGLFGDEKSRPGVHATFPSLVRDNLNSSKSGETAGGSFGLGKATLWRASGLNTVLFSSSIAPGNGHDDQSGKLRFIGKTELTWHEFEDDPYAGPGWLSENFDSVWAEPAQLGDLFLDRELDGGLLPGVTESGTSALIVDFQDSEEDQVNSEAVLERLRLAVARNFWPAISSGGWSAEIVHIVDGTMRSRVEVEPEKTPFRPFVEAYRSHLAEEVAARPAPGDTVRGIVQMAVPGSRPNAMAVSPSKPAASATGTLLVRLAEDVDQDADFEDCVALVREPLMVVKYWRRRNLVVGGKPFHGVLLAGTTVNQGRAQLAFEQFLRLSEPPAHDQWRFNQDLKDNYVPGAKRELDKFWEGATGLLRDYIRPEDDGDSEQPEHFKRLFQVPGDDPQPRIAKLRSSPVLKDGTWRLSGSIKVLDRQKSIRARIGLMLVPESGKSTALRWELLKVVRATRGSATVDGDALVIAPGTSSIEFVAESAVDPRLPRMDRCVARATEHYTQVETEGGN